MRYILDNNHLKVIISDLGATLVSFIDLNSGIDMVLGYENDEDYIKNFNNYYGATVGRNANRIANGRFVLNDNTYQLSINDNMNNLHGGGINGFSYKTFNLVSHDDNHVTLSYYSKDKEEGFPGNLNLEVTYELKDNSLIYSFKGNCDQDTLFNITNHSYFNLGDKDILNHYLHITTNKYSPTDEYALTLDEVKDVNDTAYDFNEFKKIIDNLSLIDSIDNNYVWENLDDKLMCELKYKHLQLNIYSDLPDMHVYTGTHLDNDLGKYQRVYNKYAGIALECQYYPNGINYGDKYLLPILKKDEEISHYIKYEIKEV